MPAFPGLIVPPGVVIPDNWLPWIMLLIDQAKYLPDVFSETWVVGDPLPEGVNWNTYYIFPAEWVVGDPLPPGVTAEPGAYFPAGWVVGDPLPASFDYDASLIFPPGWTPENPPPAPYIPGYDPSIPPLPAGPTPPAHVDPWIPGPPHPPTPTPPAGWLVRHNNTYWTPEAAFGEIEWEAANQRWRVLRSSGALQNLRAKDGWAVDYQPGQIEITWNGPSGKTFAAAVLDQNGEQAGSFSSAASSPVTAALTWESGGYLDLLNLGGSAANENFYVTNIRFAA
ncbi:MAG: hypothetical protein Q7J98_10230 [Kiritimatiellia bacterium]|nr:hypothetical protein [Kiritimatiellia bacterium]